MSATSRPDRTRDRAVGAVGVLFLALGVLDVWRGVAPMIQRGARPWMAGDDALVLAIGVAALIGGYYVIQGRNWARWLLAAWMAFHVAISVGKPTSFVAHLVIFGGIAWLLFRRGASPYFARRSALVAEPDPPSDAP